jgi:hypothetical protein
MPLGGVSSRLVHPSFHRFVQASAVGDRGMPDRCVIKRAGTGAGTTASSGNWTPPAASTVYGPDGPCRIQARPTSDRIVEVGDQVVTLHAYWVGIEALAAQIIVDDVVTITDSADGGDDLLRDENGVPMTDGTGVPMMSGQVGDWGATGRHLIVRDVHYDSFLTRRLLLCDDHPEIPTAAVS